MPFTSSDVLRNNVVTVPELISDGYGPNSVYLFTDLVSTSASQVVTVDLSYANDVSLLYEGDFQVNSGDLLYIYNTSPGGIADGYYTINSVTGVNTLTVNESLANSTGGYIQFRFNSGSTLVGVNSSGMTTVTGNTRHNMKL
jgi:hypothetical protein